MSTQALGGLPGGIAAGELAVAQRVAQLEAMIESAGQVASGTAPASSATGSATASSGGNFASALQTATTADASAAAGTSDAAYAPLSQGSAAGAEGGQYESLIAQAAARNGLEPAVLHGLIEQESGFDPSATSSAGAAGLTQLMPGTASSLGVADPLNPAESIEGGARYLGGLMSEFGGNTTEALAAYNAGPGAVEQYGGVPPYAETQSYVAKVLSDAESYRQSHPETTGTAL